MAARQPCFQRFRASEPEALAQRVQHDLEQLEQARACFAQALVLREQLGDQRFMDSTRKALEALDKPLGEILGTSLRFSLDGPVVAADE
jgi:hypothetical protein